MASFGLRYFAELRSKYKDVFWRVEIAERGFVGAAEEMHFDGGTPLSITWERRGDEFYIPVKGSEATINILCLENFHYINLFTADPRKFRVSIYRNTKLYWRGYVVADLYSENFTAPPYQVSIKAVDGFNLLSSVPFFNLDNSQITGRRTLWELMSMCFDLLELDVDIADWMDLYAEGMNESISPLRQLYIDMERLYYVYSEPTYRDVLELCLRPFAGQIFQSNGALHIRRTISLYNDTRPMSFYSVGTEFPLGWLIAADGRNLETHDGEPIITESTRERIESMWQEGLKVDGTTTMDIVPALRKVSVSVRNKMLQNLVPHLGFYNLSTWTDPYEFLTLIDEKTIRFAGDSAHKNYILNHKGYQVHQCSYKLTIEFMLKTYYRRWSTLGGYRPNGEYSVTVEYGFKLVGVGKTYYLQDDGQWVTSSDATIVDKVNISLEMNKKLEVNGIPIAGRLVFFIKQLPSRRISGEIFSGKHLDMNSVLQDDKFLKAGFYINSIELDTLKDEFNSELVEMPKLLQKELPPNGDDCVLMATLGFTVITAIRCENQIILHGSNNKMYRYDTASETVIEVCTVPAGSKIYPSDGSFTVISGTTLQVIDYRGVVIRTLDSVYNSMATFMGGYIYTLIKYTGREERPTLYYQLYRPEYKFVSLSYRRGYGEPSTYMYGEVQSLVKSFSSIAISTDQRAYLHDRRSNTDLTMYIFEDGTEILSMSDYFLCINYPGQLRIYHRDTISFDDKTLVKSISGKALFADHTLGEVAYLMGTTLSIWTYRNNSTRTIKNLAGGSRALKGLFYINGELYIVRDNAIFKHII